jgi:hypothetical protein
VLGVVKIRYSSFKVSSWRDVSAIADQLWVIIFTREDAELTFAIDKQDDVLAKGLVQASIHRENLDDLVSQVTGRRPLLDWIMGRNHELLVQNQLQATD